MEEKDINTIQTTRGELRYYRDWANFDGGVVMLNAQTIDRYKELKNQHPNADECGVFFAFSNKQFVEGYKHLVELGHIKEGDKIIQANLGGLFGTREGMDKFFNFYDESNKLIPQECDPQEVYFYEYNNHESMIAWDGDKDAFQLIVRYFGENVANTIHRL